jgi:hypothetical protein
MITPTPEQLAQWREDAYKEWSNTHTGHLRNSDVYIEGYLRAKTEQATEIAALKAQVAELRDTATSQLYAHHALQDSLAEVMPLTKFGAMVARFIADNGTNIGNRDLSAMMSDSNIAEEMNTSMYVTSETYKAITQLLKE